MARAIDSTLPDGEWLAASDHVFRETIGSYYGTPETMAGGGHQRFDVGDFGVALLFYRKSVDMLHTAYVCMEAPSRSPSAGDAPILEGFCTALSETVRQHPDAEIAETVREVTHRLRSISAACDDVGLDVSRYRRTLDRVAATAPDVSLEGVLWR